MIVFGLYQQICNNGINKVMAIIGFQNLLMPRQILSNLAIIMNKSLSAKPNKLGSTTDRSFNLGAPTQRNNTIGTATERTRALSNQRIIRPLTYTKEIVIKTQEADIPQITILKIERSLQSLYKKAFQLLEATLQRRKLKNLFLGFSHICQKTQQTKLLLINLNRLATFLKNKQKRQISSAWQKLANTKLRHKSKLNASRIISKFSIFIMNKAKWNAMQKIKQFALLKKKQEGKDPTVLSSENLQIQINKLKSLQFSQKFLALCKKFININSSFSTNIEVELQQNLLNEIQRYQIMRNKKGLHINNELVLVILNNHIITIKNLKKDIQNTANSLKDRPQNNEELSLYKKIEKQFEKNDNEIRNSFEKYKKIQQRELTRLIQNQIKIWNKFNDIPLYKSRIFISAIIVKLIKDGANPLNQFLDVLQNLISISSDAKKLQQYKNTLRGRERANTILVTITGKLIDLNNIHAIGMAPIIQRGVSENQEMIMLQIKSMKDEIRDFISKFNNPAEKQKLRKVFSSRRPKAPQQIRQLYLAMNQLIALIQNRDSKKGDKADVMMKIISTFKECLGEGNYSKWETFLAKLMNKEQFTSLLNILEQINDILNDKINKETGPINSQLQTTRKSQYKLKQQIQKLKNKNIELDKKLKNADVSKTKLQQNAKLAQDLANKDNQLNDLDRKYKQLNEKYNKLQNDKQNELLNLKMENQNIKSLYENTILEKNEQIKNQKLKNKEKDDEIVKLDKQNNGLKGNINILQITIEGMKIQIEKAHKQIQEQKIKNQGIKIDESGQILRRKLQEQNNQLRNLLNNKDKHIFDIQNRLNIILAQLNNLQTGNEKLNIQILQKNVVIKKLQESFKQRETLSNQQIQNKLEYIKKLQKIIQTNEISLNELNLQIKNLANREVPSLDDFRNQGKLLLNTQNQLKIKQLAVKQLQQKLKINEQQYQKHRIHWENQMKNINLRMSHFDSMANELRQKIDMIRNLETQLRNSSQSHQLEKQKWDNQWKNHLSKYDQVSIENIRLKSDLQQANNLISQLKLKMSSIPNSSIYLDNILLLLTNTISNFIKCHPKSNTDVNAKTSQQIYNDLVAIKIKYANIQSEMFMNFEQYVIKFVQNDIGKYRYELAIRIEELMSLKERFLQFLNKQIQFSKNYLSYKYQYEVQQKQYSTAFKSITETPIKFSEKAFNIGRQVQQKTLHAQRLFDSYQK